MRRSGHGFVAAEHQLAWWNTRASSDGSRGRRQSFLEVSDGATVVGVNRGSSDRGATVADHDVLYLAVDDRLT
jgi:hypothetical protein